MKCDMCGEVLAGASIICRKCNHNNAMKLVSNWRAKQSVVKKEESAERRYPGSSTIDPLNSPSGSATELSEMPPWRARVKEKVRQLREKRQAQTTLADQTNNQASLDQNSIVEAALSRIRRQSQTPAIGSPPRTTRRGPVAAALVEALTLDPIPRIEIKPRAARPEKTYLKPVEQVERPEILPSATPAEPVNKQEEITQIDHSTVTKPARERSTVINWDVIQEAAPKITPKLVNPTKAIPRGRVTTQIVEMPPAVSELTDDPMLPATLWIRTLAAACDFEIIAIAYLPIFSALAMFNTTIDSGALFILFLLLSAIVILYQSISLLFADRTFGMALLNIRLVNQVDKRMPVTRRQKLLRACGATIAFFFPPLNLLVIHSNSLNLSLPDLISGTSPIEE
jgi:RDD family